MRRVLAGVALVSFLSGCVGSARTSDAYEAKAAQAAAEALSHLRTALLTVRTGTDGRLLSTYRETVLVDAEQGIGSVETSFDSIQPPDDPVADRLRSDLDDLLTDGSGGVAALRIAARRGDGAGLSEAVRRLTPVADRLESFQGEHGG